MNYEKLAEEAVVSKPEKQEVLMPGQVQMEIVILLSGQWKLRFMWRDLEEGSFHCESEHVSHSVVSDSLWRHGL